MDSIFEKITKAINDFLMSVIESSLSTMFNDVNEKVGAIAAEVGKTPQQWNASVFSIIQMLSENVIPPDCGAYHTFILCYELITMITEKTICTILTHLCFSNFCQACAGGCNRNAHL